MKRIVQILNVNAIILLLIVSFSAGSRAEEKIVNHSLYGELLQKYVNNGFVNYKELKTEEHKLDQYLQLLDATKPDELGRDEQFALYANAYNAYTLKLILKHYPVKSIKDTAGFLRSPWKKKFVKIGGETMTLDEVEHKILRPRFQDARVHFAINCAAQDCPPLIAEPYQGDILDEQLENNTRAFLNNSEKNYLDGNTLYVTRLFKWFAEDFQQDPLNFVLKFAEGEFKNQLEAKKEQIKVKYLDYDWSLNGA